MLNPSFFAKLRFSEILNDSIREKNVELYENNLLALDNIMCNIKADPSSSSLPTKFALRREASLLWDARALIMRDLYKEINDDCTPVG